jgi:hypothetical protein
MVAFPRGHRERLFGGAARRNRRNGGAFSRFCGQTRFWASVDRQLLGINLHHNAGSEEWMRDDGLMHAQRWRISTPSHERRR